MFVPIQHNNRDVDSIAAYTNNTGTTAAKQNQEVKTDSRLNGGFWLLPLLLLPTVFLFRRGVIWVFFAALLPMTWTPDAQANPFLNADQKAANLYKRGEYEQAKTCSLTQVGKARQVTKLAITKRPLKRFQMTNHKPAAIT